MEALARLSGGIAHDFNNILTVITGYTELALGKIAPTDPLARSLNEVRKAGEEAAAFTRRLMALGGRQVAPPKSIDVNAVLASAGDALRRSLGEGVRLETAPGPGLGAVIADPTQVEQVLLALAENAREAMPGGGTFTVETAAADLTEGDVRLGRCLRAGPHVRIRATDGGTGMDAATLAHAFEPYFTTRPKGKGKGLGLAMVWGIVRQARGAVVASSAPGSGTTIEIHLPRADAAASS